MANIFYKAKKKEERKRNSLISKIVIAYDPIYISDSYFFMIFHLQWPKERIHYSIGKFKAEACLTGENNIYNWKI